MRFLAAALVLLAPLLAGCAAPPAAPPTADTPMPQELQVERVAAGLEVPWALAFAPDGRLFLTERPGRVRVVEDGALRAEPVASFAVAQQGEGGLLGLAVDPHFADNGLLYLMYTAAVEGSGLVNRVARFTEAGGGADAQVLLDAIPAAPAHDGGRLKFGPDGKLYVTTGDAVTQALAASEASLAGKVLRINPDGTVPGDNPVPLNPLWTKGHRNPQGIAWSPDGVLFATEHGPSGFDGPGGYDELNVLEAGGDYGWPNRYCDQGKLPLPFTGRDPLTCYTDAIAPAGMAFSTSGRYPDWNGSLFFGALRGQHLHRVLVQDGAVLEDEVLFDGTYGRIRDVVEGPDGWLYFTTSNRDGRGTPQDGDDHVYRLVLR